jgi:dTMP kinase
MEENTGLFVTFEGIEGCGKTTQITRLAQVLRQKDFDIVVTREPGGCQISDKIRSILLDSNNDSMVPETELLLYTAARAQHIAQVVRPALDQGKIVLCDRFCDATLAYQGYGRHLDLEIINQLNHYACQGTLLLDLPVEDGLGRARSRNAQSETLDEDRFEQESLEFHQRIREAYLLFSHQQSERIKVIDATGDFDEVYHRIASTILPILTTRLNDK